MNIITHRVFYFWLTGILLVASIASILVYGLPRAIDFTGGSAMQISYKKERPALDSIKEKVSTVLINSPVSIKEVNKDVVSIRTRTLTQIEHDAVLSALSKGSESKGGEIKDSKIKGGESKENIEITELSYSSVGPSLGNQFATKSLWALLAVVLAIMSYVAFAFRKVSKPVSSWGYGLIVVVILIHDIIIPTGFFAILAHFTTAEVDALFVTAILALLGYSVNDTIVIFDRIREHLVNNEKKNIKESFEQTVGKSISETMTRSINTSLTVVLALVAIVVFGAEATRVFAMVILVGVISGTYSSILLAAPLLIPIANWSAKNKLAKK